MVFKAKLHDDIASHGGITLKAKRDFGWFGNCGIKIYMKDQPAFSFYTSGWTNRISKVENNLDFPFELINSNEAVSGDDRFRLNINRSYLFTGNYGELEVNGHTVAKLRLKQRLFGIELTMQPANDQLNDETKLKSAILILANIVHLDGSI